MTTRGKWIKIDTRYVNEIHVRPTENVICWTKTTGGNNESYWARWSLGSLEWVLWGRGSRIIPQKRPFDAAKRYECCLYVDRAVAFTQNRPLHRLLKTCLLQLLPTSTL